MVDLLKTKIKMRESVEDKYVSLKQCLMGKESLKHSEKST